MSKDWKFVCKGCNVFGTYVVGVGVVVVVVVVLVVVSKYGGGNTMLLVVEIWLLEVVVLFWGQHIPIDESDCLT